MQELKIIRPTVLKLIEMFYNSKSSFVRKTNFVALAAEEYGFLEGCIKSTEGYCIGENDYYEHLKKVVIPYSEAVGYAFEGRDYMVGALARMNLNKEALHSSTKKDIGKYLKVFPSFNVYHNNLAQAIEILHSIDHSIDLLENNIFAKEEQQKIEYRDAENVGVIEAPRGTLYYHLSIKKDGFVKEGRIIVPTQQNQINMADDISKLVQDNISKSKKWIAAECEKLIRAYDPCMSCASHFLRVKWR